MVLDIFIKGMIVGALISIPLGPTGVFCVRNALVHGTLCGFISGLGAAVADALYATIAGFGVSAASPFIVKYGDYFQFFGALCLCFIGIDTFFAKPKGNGSVPLQATHTTVFMTTFVLTITNPLTILGLAAIYAALGIGHSDLTAAMVGITTLGVFVGSTLSWLVLSLSVSVLKERMTDRSSLWLNRVSGVSIVIAGIVAFFV